MTDQGGIYLIIEFDWPDNVDKALAHKAHHLHTTVQGQTWIREVLAASGGIGAGPGSIWVFWLEDYGALDRLLHGSDEVTEAYVGFFSQMPRVEEKIKEEVVFS